MHGKSEELRRLTEPRKEEKQKQSRFHIVKLEERIAPQHRSGHCGRARRHGYC